MLSSNSDVSTIVLPTPARFVTIGVPRKLMLTLAPYADALEDEDTQRTPELQHAVATHDQN